jgi:hypothetical protein
MRNSIVLAIFLGLNSCVSGHNAIVKNKIVEALAKPNPVTVAHKDEVAAIKSS